MYKITIHKLAVTLAAAVIIPAVALAQGPAPQHEDGPDGGGGPMGQMHVQRALELCERNARPEAPALAFPRVLVTGATSGVGKVLVTLLRERGAIPVVHGCRTILAPMDLPRRWLEGVLVRNRFERSHRAPRRVR